MNETIHTSDPRAAYLALKCEIDAAISEALSQPFYSLGPVVERFEAAFAGYCGVNYGVGVNSGTDAIHLALRGLGIGSGDEVITTSLTAVATVAAIEMSGARPVLVEVDRTFWTIDPSAVAAAVTERTRAVVAVHLYGQPVDLSVLLETCARHNLALVEDCAQSHGARWRDRPVGSFGIASCFSFYPSKNLGAIGDGGMVVTNSLEVAQNVRLLRQYGWDRPQHSVVPGWNSRLDPIQAAILGVKLKYLDQMIERRREIAANYLEMLNDLNVMLPRERELTRHAYHLFVVKMERASDRDKLQSHLANHGVLAGVHYALPVHVQPAYVDRIKGVDLRFTELLASSILSLPIYPELKDEAVEYIISAIRKFFV